MAKEAGKSEVALSDEESLKYLYRQAIGNAEQAGAILKEAFKDIERWKATHKDYSPLNAEFLQLNKQLESALEMTIKAQDMVEKAKKLATEEVENVVEVLNNDDARDRLAPASKKARVEDHQEMSTNAANLLKTIRAIDCDKIFETETVKKLPFPSLMKPPNRFHLVNGSFDYQARSELKGLYDNIVKLWMTGTTPTTVKVAGTIGYGKSHMLAVLVLLLLNNPIRNQHGHLPFVCYIPDCRSLLGGEFDVVSILQQNIFLNFPGFKGSLNTIADIRAVMTGNRVILIADQWNSIDDGDSKCQEAIKRFDSCLGPTIRVKVHGLSMNAKTWVALLPKQTSDERYLYNGGFKDKEFQVWLKRHPEIFATHKAELALLTGKVPLLLSLFSQAYTEDASWECIVQRVERDSVVQDWERLLQEFYKGIDSENVWRVLTLSVDWISDSSIIDFRFFIKDSENGFCATSEMVMRLLYRVWSKKASENAILAKWETLLVNSLNQSTLGFYVEEIMKAQICYHGVPGFYVREKQFIRRQRFAPGTEESALLRAMNENTNNSCWSLLDPEVFNYPGVDMILITETHIIGINVTIAKKHSPLKPFFDNWKLLADNVNMSIKGLFIAPDEFRHQETDVDTAFFRDAFNELWKKLQHGNHSKRGKKLSDRRIAPQPRSGVLLPESTEDPIPDHLCQCKTGCRSARCGCRHRGKPCNSQCTCTNCTNRALPSVVATRTLKDVPGT